MPALLELGLHHQRREARPLGRVGTEYDLIPAAPDEPTCLVRQSDAAGRRRSRLATSWRKLHANLETDATRRAAAFFRHFQQTIAGRVAKIGFVGFTVDELFHPRDFRDDFNRLFKPAWLGAAYGGIQFESDWIGSREVRQQRAAMFTQRDDGGPPPSFHVDLSPEMQKRIKDWLGEREAGVWGKIGASTHERLSRAIRRGLAEGDSFDAMQARINTVLKSQTDYAARRIARTETTGSMNFGQQIERDDIGIEFKEWISTLDIRTRGVDPKDAYNHISADGQTVSNKEMFNVSGQHLAYPGDGSHGAGAGNVCNCRCCGAAAFPDEPLKPLRAKTPVVTPVEPEGTALGVAVSKALAPVGTRSQVATVKEVLSIIDSVHGDGTLPKIPVTWNRATSTNGSYAATVGGDARAIKASTIGDHPLMTLAHEIGHFLDHQSLGDKGRFATHGATSATSQKLAPLLKVLRESAAVKRLDELQYLKTVPVRRGAKAGTVEVERKYVSYLLRSEEMFARAYAQWVTLRSGNPAIVKQLDTMRGKITSAETIYPHQWSDDDFAPVALAIDALFRLMKWMK